MSMEIRLNIDNHEERNNELFVTIESFSLKELTDQKDYCSSIASLYHFSYVLTSHPRSRNNALLG